MKLESKLNNIDFMMRLDRFITTCRQLKLWSQETDDRAYWIGEHRYNELVRKSRTKN